MKFERWKIISGALFVMVVAGAYVSAGPRVPMDIDGAPTAAAAKASPTPSAAVVEGKWGVDNQLSDGILLNITEPASFKAQDPESLGVEGLPEIFTVTVTNKGSKPFDLSSFTILDTSLASDSSVACSDVFESASDVKGIPEDPVVKVGQSVSFKWAIVCPGPKGDGLTMTVGLNDEQHLTLSTTLK